MRIRQLPELVANQIAAGEVIERPASIVKELLENSLDAGATEIHIEIGYGGLNQVKISDNGAGIVAEDLPLAIAAHATSKISKLDDLYAIDSMGFRGEALASIASVAKLSISSRPAHQENAVLLKTQGAEFTLTPCARTKGTTVDVCDIFYNAPVRKRFLKSEKIEFQAIEAVVKRFALSAVHIALTLKHNGKLVLSLPASTNEDTQLTRIAKIFGQAFIRDAVYMEVESSGMRLYGWLSGSSYQRSQNDRLWVYINQRMVKDKLINHALKQAYDGLLHPGRFPACLLYFSIDNKEVDVNVHPTKHEVRFTQARLVHDFFSSNLAKALQVKTENATGYPESSPPHHPEQSFGRHPEYIAESHNIRPNYSHETARELQWTFINNTFALIFLEEQPYVVDVAQLYQLWLAQQLKDASKPLSSRPLLVPIKYPFSEKLKEKLPKLTPILGQLGIKFDTIDGYIVIKTIPIQTPYLDIAMLFRNLVLVDAESEEAILAMLIRAQALDVKFLSQDERLVLNHFLLNTKTDTAFCKQITENDCRVLVYA